MTCGSIFRATPQGGIEREDGTGEVAMTGEHLRLLERVDGVDCPRCHSALFPITTHETPEGFAFACSEAHIVCLRDLFAVQSNILRKNLEGLIKTWEQAVRQMADGADIARQNGFGEVADRLGHRISDLKSRIRILREVFLTPNAACGI